ncbi:hypothetical protein LMG22037_05963 [Paraburkholderia phenoliruptrix]|uniref:Uncharacterized protein n=1 Tax=Paraburkholderia phenoliruptrix TaxID=252970 RepID=A0A6J5CHP0_9BURK|nr:hypothetical protein [Paraburkholderia phenoliruptrix]CAB3735407.1 hypothetical protein LMG22037_05963 [Paraburkholderia phenoliruptrix]
MPQATALTSLVNQAPFNQLIGGAYSTIWIQKKGNGYAVSGRSKADESVMSLTAVGAPALVIDLDGVLGGGDTVDVKVGGAAYGITKTPIGGGTEYIVTEHARIPPSARGIPTIII